MVCAERVAKNGGKNKSRCSAEQGEAENLQEVTDEAGYENQSITNLHNQTLAFFHSIAQDAKQPS